MLYQLSQLSGCLKLQSLVIRMLNIYSNTSSYKPTWPKQAPGLVTSTRPWLPNPQSKEVPWLGTSLVKHRDTYSNTKNSCSLRMETKSLAQTYGSQLSSMVQSLVFPGCKHLCLCGEVCNTLVTFGLWQLAHSSLGMRLDKNFSQRRRIILVTNT